MGKWEDAMIIQGFSKSEIRDIRKARSIGGKKGGRKKVPKGLALLSIERRKQIGSMGGEASRKARLKNAN